MAHYEWLCAGWAPYTWVEGELRDAWVNTEVDPYEAWLLADDERWGVSSRAETSSATLRGVMAAVVAGLSTDSHAQPIANQDEITHHPLHAEGGLIWRSGCEAIGDSPFGTARCE